ncbi:MAG: hypothetical protein E7218_02385 [Anaerofustis stercorihominis]|nr:hypothetical protein [Anaerofustis stercorihominis]
MAFLYDFYPYLRVYYRPYVYSSHDMQILSSTVSNFVRSIYEQELFYKINKHYLTCVQYFCIIKQTKCRGLNMNKKLTILLLIILTILNIFPSGALAASTYTLATADVNKNLNDSGCYKTVKTYTSFTSAYSALNSSADKHAVVLKDGKLIAMKSGMIITKETSGGLFHFTNLFGNGYTPYTNTKQVGYYLGNKSESEIMLEISGFEGTTKLRDVILVPAAFCYPYNKAGSGNRYEFDYYTKNSSGDLVHYISSYSSSNGGYTTFASITVDKAPAFMKKGVRYYSTDGYVYYEDPIDAAMEKNEVGRHCIYYKNLSYRSVTSYTAAKLDSYTKYKTGGDSAYSGYGYAFIKGQKTYGVNAAMEMAFANHESAYGESGYATNRYNFFGVGAVDSNPDGAYEYTSPEDGIIQHMKYYMNRYFFDAYAYVDSSRGTAYYDVPDKSKGYISDYTGDSRYFGTNPGNKNAGVNTRYASDPFHGEKVSAHMYAIDKYLGLKDYGKYSIGMTKSATYAYAKPSTSSWKVYKYSCRDRNRKSGTVSKDPVGMMVTIVGEEGSFYKVLSEMPMDKNGLACYAWNYDHDLSYVYVKKSDIDLIYDCGNLANEAAMKNISVTGYDIGFKEDVYEYFLTVDNSVTDVEVKATAKYPDNTVTVENKSLTAGKFTQIVVKVKNSTSDEKIYTVNVYRNEAVSHKNLAVTLKSISASRGTFTYSFDPKVDNYTLYTDSLSSDVTFTCTPTDKTSKTEVLGGSLEGGQRLYTIVVTSAKGDVSYYRIRVISPY